MQNGQIPIHTCKCGCGTPTVLITRNRPERGWIKGRYHTYITGHNGYRNKLPKRTGQKWCRKCQDFRPLGSFQVCRTAPDGLQSLCAACNKAVQTAWRNANREKRRDYQLKSLLKKFKVTVQDYQNMLHAQNSACAVCQQPESTTWRGTKRSLAIDHCHKTGKIRGLLCTKCNTALGLLKENAAVVKRLHDYILKRCSAT